MLPQRFSTRFVALGKSKAAHLHMINYLHWISLPILIMSAVVHEVAHGYAAAYLGDPTARERGRLSLNPLVHVDWMLTVIVPVLLVLSQAPFIFGGAKPVPVQPRFLLNPKRDMGLIAIAGPLSNFVLAALVVAFANVYWWTLAALLPLSLTIFVTLVCFAALMVNLILAIFNLTPILPLDGGRIVLMLLPHSLAAQYARLEKWGFLIVLILLFQGYLDTAMVPVINFLLEHSGLPNGMRSLLVQL